MLLLEPKTTSKRQVDRNAMELDIDNKDKEYKMEAIQNSAVYARESKLGYLLGLYYLMLWKGYSEEKIT